LDFDTSGERMLDLFDFSEAQLIAARTREKLR